MNPIRSFLPGFAVFAACLFSVPGFGADPDDSLEKRFQLVLPSEAEERWKAVGWHTNLMAAREIAQEQGRPVFFWIMVGNPHGCT